MRKSIRWILFALTADSWQRDRLIDKDKKIKRLMRKSILLNVSSSKTIARFEAKFDVTKACFFVVVCYRLLICAFTDQCWFISTMMIRFKSVYCMWSLLLNDDTRFRLLSSRWSISKKCESRDSHYFYLVRLSSIYLVGKIFRSYTNVFNILEKSLICRWYHQYMLLRTF
jgi:hypothetical protein